MVEGAWSIGNELYFYLLFPVLIFLSKKAKWISISFYSLIGLIAVYFAFILLSANDSLRDQWSFYIHSLNQYYLFVGGAAMIALGSEVQPSKTLLISLFAISVLVFLLIPVDGTDILMVVGLHRVIYSLCCLGICFSILKLKINYPKSIHAILGFMGKISYSMYLIHPIVILVVLKAGLFPELKALQMLIVLMLTFGISGLVYYLIEEKFIKLAGAISARFKNRMNGKYGK
jgi:peptidoglycan/LPS O-acetylase OafA/YrhL